MACCSAREIERQHDIRRVPNKFPEVYSFKYRNIGKDAVRLPRLIRYAQTLRICGILVFIFICDPVGAATNIYYFNYPDRSYLLADGWSFKAITNVLVQDTGDAVFIQGEQDTEITNASIGSLVSYAQTNSALGIVTRIPCEIGTIWGSTFVWTNGTWPSLPPDPSANQTRNSLFRDLPTNWVSMELKFSFAPFQNYQTTSLLLYEDDDNYVGLGLRYNSDLASQFGLSSPIAVSLVEESYGFPYVEGATVVSGTNVTLRLDRDPVNQSISAFVSEDEITWSQVGEVAQSFANPRLGIIVAGSSDDLTSEDLPECDLAEVDIVTSDDYSPPPALLTLRPQHLVFNGFQGQASVVTQAVNIVVSGVPAVVNWNVTSDSPWLMVNTNSGETPSFCYASVNTSGLGTGIYQGTLTFTAVGPTNVPASVNVSLIVNPNGLVKVSTWKDAKAGAMSVWVDDSDPTAFDDLNTNGLTGTYVMWHQIAPAFYTQYYDAGMELGSHTVDHPAFAISDSALRYQLESNIVDLEATSPVRPEEVISLAWPAGATTNSEEAIASDYFLIARGYNWNQLESATPVDFMNVRSYNSHEHFPFPPADLKTVVDAAINQGLWFNLVLHTTNNDNGAIAYSVGKNIWFDTGGAVTKYIYQRDRTVITNYVEGANAIQFSCYRLPLDSSPVRGFETALQPSDVLTFALDIPASEIAGITMNGSAIPFSQSGGVTWFDSLITTNLQSFVVNVGSTVMPPVLSPQPNMTNDELVLLTVTNAATDSSYPPQTLTYSLSVTNTIGGDVQTNASISADGVINWMPTEAQGPGIYWFTTIVTDGETPPLSATNSFSVTVNEVNTPPVLPAVADQIIFSSQTLVVTNRAVDSDIPANALGYTLSSAPPSASISADGVIAWTPSPGQFSSTNTFVTVVTDTNDAAVNAKDMSATNSFVVTVVTNLIRLPPQADRSVNELVPLVITNTAFSSQSSQAVGGLTTNLTLFDYPDRSGLLADGWNFMAINTNGTLRNTEISDTNVGVIAYAGSNNSLGTVLHLPCDVGNMWAAANNSRNSLFQSLTANWVSMRLHLAFNPSVNYQEALLGLYQDDDNYVVVDRAFNSFTHTQSIEFSRELNQAPVTLNSIAVAATNLWLRLDRDPASGNIAGLYSLDGSDWITVGQTSQAFTNAEMVIWSGGSTVGYTNTYLTCDLSLLAVVVTNSFVPLTYELAVTNQDDGSMVTNAVMDSNGVISWTPTEAQGPGHYVFTTVTSNGKDQAMNSFEVTVNEVNTPPILPLQPDLTISGSTPVVVTNTATDFDLPLNPLGYLLSGPPGSQIDTSGIIYWNPSPQQVPSTNLFTTVVTDTNVWAVNAQNLSATNAFTVVVNAASQPPAPEISAITISGNVAMINAAATTGHYYRLQSNVELTLDGWADLSPDILATNATISFSSPIGELVQQFYRVMLVR